MKPEKRLRPALRVMALLLALLLIASCAGVKARKQSFSSYVFAAVDNPTLSRDVAGAIDWMAKIVTVVVPPGTRVSSLVATFVAPEGAAVYVRSQGSTIAQVNGVTENDFRRPVQYLLVLEDKTEVEFVVKVREAETNPNLASLTLADNLAFTPGFSTNVESYSVAEVPYAVAELRIRPNAESPYAAITIDGRRYPARNATASVPLRAGELNAVAIVVTAEDGATTRTYTLNVRRAEPERISTLAGLSLEEGIALTPKFAADIRSYQIKIPYAQATLTFTALPTSAVATVTVQGKPATPGKPSAPVTLGEELSKVIEIVVTAQDGTTRTSYVVNVQRSEPDRNSSLAGIALNEGATLTPRFSGATTRYSVTIPNTMDTVILTPTAASPVATLKVAGKALASGSAAAPLVLAEESTVSLEIVVTAQDNKTTTTYYLDVTRKPLDPSWTQASAGAGFSGRYGFETVVFKGRLWVIGGSSTNLDFLNDIWYSEDGVKWTKATENPGFSPRRNHQVVEFKGRLWLIGGETGMYEYQNDVWSSSDGIYWTRVAVEQPFPKRVNHQVVEFKGQLWLIGGHGTEAAELSVWSSKDGQVWTAQPGTLPDIARDSHRLIAFKDELYVIAGQKGSARFADVWSSKDGLTWTKAADLQQAGFRPRILHAAAEYAGRLWVSGGYTDGVGALNDVWYSKDGREWKLATEAAGFPARLGHQMETFKGRLWLIGGTDNKVSRSDVWYSNAKE